VHYIEYSTSTETKECRFQKKENEQLEKLTLEELNSIKMPTIIGCVDLT